MKKSIFIMLVFPFLMSTTCEGESSTCHKRIILKNNTDKTLYVDWTTDTLFSYIRLYDEMNIVMPNTTDARAFSTRGCFENKFEYQSLTGVISLFVLDNEVLKTVPRNEIIKNNMYLRRYDVTLEDLQRMNWTIVYSEEEE